MKDDRAIGRAQPAPDPSVERGESGGRDGPVTFVIVLALEAHGVAVEPEWRWRVRSVQTGEEARFRKVADVLAYVAVQAGVPAPR